MSEKAASTIDFRHIKPGEHLVVAEILQHYASQEILLWRNADDILDHKESFFVAVHDTTIIGCVAVHNYGNDLYELRSLAIKESCTGQGLGSILVNGVIEECRNRNAKTLFALTSKVSFFKRNGFIEESMANFPEKVWKDCQLCRKKDCCDETALAIRF